MTKFDETLVSTDPIESCSSDNTGIPLRHQTSQRNIERTPGRRRVSPNRHHCIADDDDDDDDDDPEMLLRSERVGRFSSGISARYQLAHGSSG